MQIGIFGHAGELGPDEDDCPLGSLEEVLEKIRSHWPDAYIGRYSWGYEGSYDNGECRISMDFLTENNRHAPDAKVTCIGIEAHGDYECFEPLISDLCKGCGWDARDMDTGDSVVLDD